MIGQVKVTWDSAYVQGPDREWLWVYNTTDERSYYIKDHLGSIRLTFNENNEVLNAQDYHPYGEVLRGYVAEEGSRYMFTEKERDTETNYDYFGARFYDSELGRWLSVDPLADKYPGWSPYNYVSCNPLFYVDLKGDSIQVSGMQSQLQYNFISSVSQATGTSLYVTATGMLAPTPTTTIFGQTVQLASAYGTPTGGGSQEAASFLNYAMSNSTIVNTIGTSVLGSQGGGQLVRLNPKEIESFINGTPADLNSATMGYGMVFLHELTHTDLGQSYHNSPTPLVDPTSGTGTGFVVDYINRIRAELGPDYGQRTNYAATQGTVFKFIPFNSVNGRTRITFP